MTPKRLLIEGSKHSLYVGDNCRSHYYTQNRTEKNSKGSFCIRLIEFKFLYDYIPRLMKIRLNEIRINKKNLIYRHKRGNDDGTNFNS